MSSHQQKDSAESRMDMDTTPVDMAMDGSPAASPSTASRRGKAAIFPGTFPHAQCSTTVTPVELTVKKNYMSQQIDVTMAAPTFADLDNEVVTSTYQCTCCGNMQINLHVARRLPDGLNVYREFVSKATFLNPETSRPQEYDVDCIQTIDAGDIRNTCKRRLVF